jgi:hypothetical protein
MDRMGWIARMVGLVHTVLPVPPLLPYLPVLIYSFSALRQRAKRGGHRVAASFVPPK